MRYLALFLVGVLLATPAFAQSANRIIIQGSNGNLAEVNSSGELEVTGGGGGGGAVTIADGADVAEGALADAACATDNGTCSVIALIKRANQRLTSLIASLGGTGSTGSAVPATAVYTGVATDAGLAAGTPGLAGLINCQSQAVVSEATSGNNEIVALTASERIYVCGYMLVGAGVVDVQWVYGTGSDCGTSETDLTGLMSIAAAGGGMADSSPFWRGLAPATGNALCLELSGDVQVSGWVSYTKF